MSQEGRIESEEDLRMTYCACAIIKLLGNKHSDWQLIDRKAVIAALPVVKADKNLFLYDYQSKKLDELESVFLKAISDRNIISEILLINK